MNFREYLTENKAELDEGQTERYYAKDIKDAKLKGKGKKLADMIIANDGSINAYGVESINMASDKQLTDVIKLVGRQIEDGHFDGQNFGHAMDRLRG